MFTDAETEIATKAPVAVLTHEAWQTRFAGDPAILGKTLMLNGQAHTVVGVTPPNVQAPFGRPDVFIPIPYYPNASGLQRGNRGMLALGALKRGVTIETASRDLKALAKQQEDAYPTTNKGFGVDLQPLKEQLVGQTRAPIYIVFAAVAIVLLIACANVANLQLARGAARYRELSVRAALGAGRARIVQQLLTESLILSLVGGAAGIALARARDEVAQHRTRQYASDHDSRSPWMARRSPSPRSSRSHRASCLVSRRRGKASRTNVHDMLRSSNRRRRLWTCGNAQHAGHRAARALARAADERRLAHAFAHRTAARQTWFRYEEPDDDAVPSSGRRSTTTRTRSGRCSSGRSRRSAPCPVCNRRHSCAHFPSPGNGDSYPVQIEGRAPAASPRRAVGTGQHRHARVLHDDGHSASRWT